MPIIFHIVSVLCILQTTLDCMGPPCDYLWSHGYPCDTRLLDGTPFEMVTIFLILHIQIIHETCKRNQRHYPCSNTHLHLSRGTERKCFIISTPTTGEGFAKSRILYYLANGLYVSPIFSLEICVDWHLGHIPVFFIICAVGACPIGCIVGSCMYKP